MSWLCNDSSCMRCAGCLLNSHKPCIHESDALTLNVTYIHTLIVVHALESIYSDSVSIE